MFKPIAILVTSVAFISFAFGYKYSEEEWIGKYNAYLIQQTEEQKEKLDAKDKTISLIIDRYNSLKAVNDKSSVLVGRLQYQLNQANRKLTKEDRLRGCQELLSEGIGLLREGQGLSERLIASP